MFRGKKYQESAKQIDKNMQYDAAEGMALICKTASAKFDETVELHVKLGVDSRHADQQDVYKRQVVQSLLPVKKGFVVMRIFRFSAMAAQTLSEMAGRQSVSPALPGMIPIIRRCR